MSLAVTNAQVHMKHVLIRQVKEHLAREIRSNRGRALGAGRAHLGIGEEEADALHADLQERRRKAERRRGVQGHVEQEHHRDPGSSIGPRL